MYCSSNFIRFFRDFRSSKTKEADFKEMISDMVNHDIVILPFFPNQEAQGRQETLMVTLQPNKWSTDLFEREMRGSIDSELTVKTATDTVS